MCIWNVYFSQKLKLVPERIRNNEGGGSEKGGRKRGGKKRENFLVHLLVGQYLGTTLTFQSFSFHHVVN